MTGQIIRKWTRDRIEAELEKVGHPEHGDIRSGFACFHTSLPGRYKIKSAERDSICVVNFVRPKRLVLDWAFRQRGVVVHGGDEAQDEFAWRYRARLEVPRPTY